MLNRKTIEHYRKLWKLGHCSSMIGSSAAKTKRPLMEWEDLIMEVLAENPYGLMHKKDVEEAMPCEIIRKHKQTVETLKNDYATSVIFASIFPFVNSLNICRGRELIPSFS